MKEFAVEADYDQETLQVDDDEQYYDEWDRPDIADVK